MKLQIFQHAAFEGPGAIAEWAEARRHAVKTTALYQPAKLPAIEDVDLLIVLGGPMGATDDHRLPWMRTEKVFIEAMMQRGKPVLGICLGAQLIADVLGARVAPNREKEIGWFPIELDPPHARESALHVMDQRSIVFHWHGDTFDLPKGAVHLARSQACENQAFGIGKSVLGLQFHLELAAPQIETLIDACPGDLHESGFVQTPEEMLELAHRYAAPLEFVLYRLLDQLTAP